MRQIIIFFILCLTIFTNCKKNEYIVDASILLVREAPSTKSKIIGRLKVGDNVTIVEETKEIEIIDQKKAPWVKIEFDNRFGYVFSGYLYKSSNKEKSYSEIKNELKYLSCDKSIKLDDPEHAYGPPSTPKIDTSIEVYQSELSKYTSFQNKPDSVIELAYLAYENNDFPNAEKYFKLCLPYKEFETPYYKRLANYFLACIYERQNDFEKAKKYYIEHDDKYYIHLIDAKIYEKNGKLNLAEKELLLAQSVDLYEMENYEPFRLLAEMFYKHHQYIRALIYIEQFISCAEEEKISGGKGYIACSDEGIESAKKFLNQIKDKL